MFTGLITEIGQVGRSANRGEGLRLAVYAPSTADSARVGDSIAVNGVCLSVVAKAGKVFEADVMSETIAKTNLRLLGPGSRVNLERALRADQHLEGHLVQGHIDGVGRVIRVNRRENSMVIWIKAPAAVRTYLARKGSIAVDGVSLTIADIEQGTFSISLIPHTRQVTNLGDRRAGDLVNLEADVIAKYLSTFVETDRSDGVLTVQRLKELGY